MRKADLVEFVFESGAAGETRVAAERAVEAVLAAIRRGLKRDKKVRLTGFGVFSVRKRRARSARNPRTGERIAVAARRGVSFRPSEHLRADIATAEA